MALDPANSAVDRVRINTGDVDQPYIIDSAIIQYFLDDNGGDEYIATIKTLEAILAMFAKYTHEEVGDEEVWGQEAYENYRKLLQDYKNNPSYKSNFNPYAGGISKSDVKANRNNSDANRPGISEGWTTRSNSSIWD